ncbi:MAG: fatty acid desaturase [Gammaproteobacteria bacterium]|nr:fatty acid desaturase [Gammaproteobacteria bacterium]
MSVLNGLFDLPWWGYVLYAVLVCQITIAGVTLYLHRSQAHLGLDLHPVIQQFFRAWLWTTTGMSTREWVAIHRKHHAKCETVDDPHSPRVYGIRKVLLEGAELYRHESNNAETIAKYSHGTPNDFMENKIYSGKPKEMGIYISMAINLILFGPIGLTIWALQMVWIPIHAAGGINGLGHYWGYRNYETVDDATNLIPWAFWIGGEELHNNHHAYPSSAKFSIKPWEFDIGWMYIRVLETLGLAKVKKVAPQPQIDHSKEQIDMETVKAIIRSKMHVMAGYADTVIKPVLQEEYSKADEQARKVLKHAQVALTREEVRMNESHRQTLAQTLSSHKSLELVYQYRSQLREIWERTYESQEKLLQAIIEWCRRAEQSGVEALRQFAASLRGYTLVAG